MRVGPFCPTSIGLIAPRIFTYSQSSAQPVNKFTFLPYDGFGRTGGPERQEWNVTLCESFHLTFRRSGFVRELVPLCGDKAVLTDCELELAVLLDQIETLNQAVTRYDAAIAERFAEFGQDAALFRALPGAGPALAPRLFAAVALHADACASPMHFAALSGMAPVTEQSGKTRRVYRRLRCNHFLRQTLHEWAKESWKHSRWAAAFVALHRARGQSFHSIIRLLAVKWIRILWRCWHERCAYNEDAYITSLRQRGSPLCQYLSAAT